MTLVIMAAGMGSRFGGLKQIEPVGRNGEFILDFSIYDAIQNGFDKTLLENMWHTLNKYADIRKNEYEEKIR